MSILSSHAGSWHSDKWYRRAWYIWPQAISLLLVGWLFAGALLKPTPWAQPKTSTPAQCNTFVQLRDDAQKKALAVRTAVEHKVDRKEICTLVQRYYAAESAAVKFLEENKTWCGIPDEAIKAAKGNHEHTDKFRTAACSESPAQFPQADSDEAICPQSNLANALNACSRLIDAGRTEPYFWRLWRAQIYLKNEDYDRAIEDLSKFIELNPKHVWALRWVSDDIQMGGKPYTRVGLVWAPVRTEIRNEARRSMLSMGSVSAPEYHFKSSDYQEYQCTPSEQFEGVTWCNKQRVEEEARGSYRSSYTIAHSRDGTIYYLNRFLEPAFFNAGEVDNDIERLSGKFGEPTTQRIGMPRGVADVDGLIATWGRVTLESLDSTAINEWVAGRSPPKGILIDFIGNFSNSARSGLPIYRVSGGPGFVWAASFDPEGRGTLRFFAIDPGALLPGTAKESTAPTPSSANRKTTVIDLRQIPLTGESRRLSPGSHTTF